MTLYEYRCRVCGRTELSECRADVLSSCGQRRAVQGTNSPSAEKAESSIDTTPFHRVAACTGPMCRVWSVQVAPVMQEHFNTTVQRPVSSMRQFERELRRASDVASEETEIEHRFAPVDPTDRKALGVTDEGLDATNRQRAARGQRPVPLN